MLIRNQANCIIGKSLTDGIDSSCNGERLLVETAREHCHRVIDVGANVGDWTALYLEGKGPAGAQVLAYEPGREAYGRLCQRFQQQPFVRIHNKAVGDQCERRIFWEEPCAGSRSSLVAVDATLGASERQVEVVTLDSICQEAGWAGVDLIKIDTEGFDCFVLRGGEKLFTQQRVGIVQFEYNGMWRLAGATLAAAVGFLKVRGYEVYLLRRDGLSRWRGDGYGEWFSYANFVAVNPATKEWMNAIVCV